MSWSVNFIGNPDKIVDALNKQSTTLSGQSKTEFDAALPHMIGIVSQNYNKNYTPVLSLTASGHGHDGYNTCMVTVTSLGGQLV